MVRVIFELVASFTSNGELWNLSQFCELNPQCSIISTYPGSNPNASPLIGIFYPLKIEDLSKLKANLLIQNLTVLSNAMEQKPEIITKIEEVMNK